MSKIDPKEWGAAYIKEFREGHAGVDPKLSTLRKAYTEFCQKNGKTGRFREATYLELTGQTADVSSFDGALAEARKALTAVAEAHKRSKAGHKAATTKAKTKSYSEMDQAELVAEMGKIQRALNKLMSGADDS